MAIPIVYNLRSVRARWLSALVAVLGIAGTVGVFIAMLALARGFHATLVTSGSPENALIRRAGASSELDGSVSLDQVRTLEDKPQVMREGGQPMISPEALKVRSNIHVVEGRFFTPGLAELVIGKNVASTYGGLEMGKPVNFGGGTWNVVGVFDAGGSAFDSEIWADARVLNQVYKRPADAVQSVTVRLTAPKDLDALKDSLTADPTMTVQVDREIDSHDANHRARHAHCRHHGDRSRNRGAEYDVLGRFRTLARNRHVARDWIWFRQRRHRVRVRSAVDRAHRRLDRLSGSASAEWRHHQHAEHADVLASGFRL
jgi:MacB-like periplasmic core domain